MPGRIVLTRMPSFIRSRAIGSVMPTMPAFEAAYAAWPICPSTAATEAVLTIAPRSPSASGSSASIPAADFAMQRNVPIRLIRMMRSNASSGKCAIAPLVLSRPAVLNALPVPAQLTSTRSWPLRRARRGEAGVDLRVRGDVDRAERAAQLARDRLALRGVEVEQRDLHAAGDERARRRQAQARGAAGDDRGDARVELHGG